MSKCTKCKKEVKYKTLGGKSFAVEGPKMYFVPDKMATEEFVNISGYVMKGRKERDGQYGYKLHTC